MARQACTVERRRRLVKGLSLLAFIILAGFLIGTFVCNKERTHRLQYELYRTSSNLDDVLARVTNNEQSMQQLTDRMHMFDRDHRAWKNRLSRQDEVMNDFSHRFVRNNFLYT